MDGFQLGAVIIIASQLMAFFAFGDRNRVIVAVVEDHLDFEFAAQQTHELDVFGDVRIGNACVCGDAAAYQQTK